MAAAADDIVTLVIAFIPKPQFCPNLDQIPTSSTNARQTHTHETKRRRRAVGLYASYGAELVTDALVSRPSSQSIVSFV
jgi:hypothetical protein